MDAFLKVVIFIIVMTISFFIAAVKYQSFKIATIYVLATSTAIILLMEVGILPVFLFWSLLFIFLFSAEGKRPGYPYSARASQLRAWRSLGGFHKMMHF